MPFLEANGTTIHYLLDGPEAAPVIAFSNGLGTTTALWDRQVSALCRKFRILRHDTRGHGQSKAPPPPYSIELLGCDVISLLDALKIPRVHFCGLSMGGLIGQWIANHQPVRLHSVTMCDTAAHIGAADMWNARIAKVKADGLSEIVDAVTSRWFTESFAQKFPQTIQSAQAMLLGSSADGYAACCGAIRDADFTNDAPAKAVPTLVITGARDVVTTPADAKFLVGKYLGAKYVELNGGHLSNVEDADGFTRALGDFISQVEAKPWTTATVMPLE